MNRAQSCLLEAVNKLERYAKDTEAEVADLPGDDQFRIDTAKRVSQVRQWANKLKQMAAYEAVAETLYFAHVAVAPNGRVHYYQYLEEIPSDHKYSENRDITHVVKALRCSHEQALEIMNR